MTATPATSLDLYAHARDLTTNLLPRVRALIPHTSNKIDESQIGGRADVHRIPWNGPAANLALDIAATARRHETALTLLLFQRAKFRGMTDRDVDDAINRLPVLVDHAVAQDHGENPVVADTVKDLHRWGRQCRRLLDEARDDETPWTKAPGDLRCPWCDNRLELAPGWQHAPEGADVMCRRCVDARGAWLRWPPTAWLAVLQHRDDEAG